VSGKWNPAQYDKFKQQRQQPFYDLLALVEPRQGARVIDLGCGTGELTAALHTHLQAGQTVGVDTSADMLANAASLNIEGLHFLQTDISKVLSGWRGQTLMESPLAGRYDIIFSNAALQWVPGHQSLIGDLISGLMPGGQLAVQVPAGNDHPTHTVANEIAAQEPFSTMIGESGRQVGRVDWVLASGSRSTDITWLPPTTWSSG